MQYDQTSAVLSFCLPGLGQLHQRRIAMTAVTFGVFCGLAAGSGTRVFLPLWAVAVGWEALQHGTSAGLRLPVDTAAFRRRRLVFASFGIVGFFFWFLMVAGIWFPVGTRA